MAILRGKIRSAKEHADNVWFHLSSKYGLGWVSVNKNMFENVYKKRLVRQLYTKHNRKIDREIARMKKHIRILKKEDNVHAIKEREQRIAELGRQKKKELHMGDLEGRSIYLRIV